jgi:hypothetical protein
MLNYQRVYPHVKNGPSVDAESPEINPIPIFNLYKSYDIILSYPIRSSYGVMVQLNIYY